MWRKWSKKPWTEANARENVVWHPDRLRWPYSWKQPRLVFTNSMSDVFHHCVPDEWIAEIMRVIRDCHWHTFQMLTKRSERAATWTDWPDNLWFGVSVEDRRNRTRIDHLRQTGARVKWISFEPLLEELMPYDMTGVDWSVVGGESGLDFRPMPMAAARSIRDVSVRRNRPFYFKQDSSYVTETRPWLVEENGECWRWQQYPGNMAEPELVLDPKTAAKSNPLRIL